MSLSITVSEPIKQQDKFGSYFSYRVSTSGLAMGGDASVTRRYSDFDWFSKELLALLPGTIVPALPKKEIVVSYSQEFIDSRQRGLEKFLLRCASHREIANLPLFNNFLQMDESALKSKQEDSKATKPQLATKAMSWMEGTINTIQNSGKKAEIEKSAADVQIEDLGNYMEALQKQMNLLTKHAATLIQRYRESCSTMYELGQAYILLGQTEGENVGQGLIQLGTTADGVSVLNATRAEASTLQLLEPMDEYLRLVASVQNALQQRKDKKSAYVDALTDLEVKQNAYNKSNTTPGKEEVARQQQEKVAQAQSKSDQLKIDYDQCTEKLLAEFETFKYQKAVDFRSIIIKFVESQIEHHKKSEEMWMGVLPSLNSIYIAHVGGGGSAASSSGKRSGDNQSGGGYGNPFQDSDMVGV